jgi:hypothetical protein
MWYDMVNSVIVGADMITQDTVFNKISTYTHSIVAKEHDVPFYVAAPRLISRGWRMRWRCGTAMSCGSWEDGSTAGCGGL